MKTPDTCPNCGEEVPPRAKACPSCGADEKTGWDDEAHAANPDLPDESFDYNQYVEREFGRKKVLPYGINWFWWTVAAVLAGVFVFGLFKLTR